MRKLTRIFAFAVFFSAFALAFAGCDDDEKNLEPLPDPSVIKAEGNIRVPAEGGEHKLSYTIENPIQYQMVLAHSEDAWLHDFESTSEFITFMVDANEGEPRQGKIVLDYKNAKSLTVLVEQAVENVSLSIEPKTLNFAYTGGKEQVTVTSTHHWTLECASEQSWVIPSVKEGDNGDVVEFEVKGQNQDEDSRSAEFTFKSRNISETLTITQNVQGQLLLVTESPATVAGEGGNLTIKVKSNIEPVTVSIPDEAKTWIKQIEARTMNEYQFNFEVSANDTPHAREAVLNFKNSDALEQFVVKQPSTKPNLADELTDELFRKYILDNFDVDADGILTEDEAASVTAIKLDATGTTTGDPIWKDIKSLNGIHLFKNLMSLNLVRITAPIEAVDLTQNKKLISVNFWNLGCGIAGIKCSDLPELSVFKLSRLSPWDTSEVFNELELTDIDLNGCPQLVEIQTRYLQYLKRLTFSDSKDLNTLILAGSFEKSLAGEDPVTVDISQTPKLEEFICSDRVQKLILTQAQYDKFHSILTEDQGSFYGIWAITDAPDVIGSISDPVLKSFIMSNFDLDKNNQLSSVEAQKINTIDINKENCSDVARLNSLAGLDILPYLNVLKISGATTIGAVDLLKNNWLKELELKPATELTSLNIAGLKILSRVVLDHLKAESLDLTGCETLGTLKISNATNLSTLTLKGCAALTELNLQQNNPKLTKLDIRECPLLLDPAKLLLGDALKEVTCLPEQAAAFSSVYPNINWGGGSTEPDVAEAVDPIIREFILSDRTLNPDGETVITRQIADRVTEIAIYSNNPDGEKITGVAGLEVFTNLERLIMAPWNAKFQDVDLSKCSKLTYVDLSPSLGYTSVTLPVSVTYFKSVCKSPQAVGPAVLDLSSAVNLEKVVLNDQTNESSSKLTELNCKGLTKLNLLQGSCSNLTSIDICGCELLKAYCQNYSTEGFYWDGNNSKLTIKVSTEAQRDVLKKSYSEANWYDGPYNEWVVVAQ